MKFEFDFVFYPRDAMLALYVLWLCVCLSFESWWSVEMTERMKLVCGTYGILTTYHALCFKEIPASSAIIKNISLFNLIPNSERSQFSCFFRRPRSSGQLSSTEDRRHFVTH